MHNKMMSYMGLSGGDIVIGLAVTTPTNKQFTS